MGTKKKAAPSLEQRLRLAQKQNSRLRANVAKLAAENVDLAGRVGAWVATAQNTEENRVKAEQANTAWRDKSHADRRAKAEAVQRLHETAKIAAGTRTAFPTARLLEVIEVWACEGKGETLDPARMVATYYSKEGDLLARRDTWAEDHLAKVAAASEPQASGSAEYFLADGAEKSSGSHQKVWAQYVAPHLADDRRVPDPEPIV